MGKQANALANSIRDYLTLNGFMVIKPGSGCARNTKGDFYRIGQPGISDILAWKRLKDGLRLFCIEVKYGKDRLSPIQQQFLDKAVNHGATALIARSLQDVISCLEWVNAHAERENAAFARIDAINGIRETDQKA